MFLRYINNILLFIKTEETSNKATYITVYHGRQDNPTFFSAIHRCSHYGICAHRITSWLHLRSWVQSGKWYIYNRDYLTDCFRVKRLDMLIFLFCRVLIHWVPQVLSRFSSSHHSLKSKTLSCQCIHLRSPCWCLCGSDFHVSQCWC